MTRADSSFLESAKTAKPLDKGLRASLSLAEEFRAFALKGNVVDLAVGVIIGAAFAKIVDSLVKNLIMPLVSLVLPTEQSYLTWKVAVGAKEIPYGLVLGDILNFVLVALALFLFVVKFLGWITKNRAKQAAAAAPAAPVLSRDQELLTEIRDLIRTQSHQA